MKELIKLKGLLILSLLLLSVACQSQSDSSLYNNEDIRHALILIEEGKECCANLKIEREFIDSLQEHLNRRDKQLNGYKLLDETNKEIIFNKNMLLGNKDIQIASQMSTISNLNKSLRNQKRKTFFIGTLGLAAVGYLLFK